MAQTMQERFDKYHEKNPWVYIAFDVLAKKAIARGLKKFSARTIWHKLRWDRAIEKGETREYRYALAKLDNNWTPFYSLLWLKNNPEYPDFFETRKTKAEKEDPRLSAVKEVLERTTLTVDEANERLFRGCE